MTPERAKQLLPVIQAFAEGKTIQSRCCDDTEWNDNSTVGWFDNHEYRVKPEPREFWTVVGELGHSIAYTSKDIAKAANFGNLPIIRVREVVE